jgi:glycosyltransferase involved in cell wall biosynthesis
MPDLTNKCWVFIDYTTHMNPLFPSLGERISKHETVVVVERPVSILRGFRIPSLKARCSWRSSAKRYCHYRPLHFPEGLPAWRRISQWLNFYFLEKELDQLVPPHLARIVIYGCPIHNRIAGKLGEVLKIYYAQDDKKVTITGKQIPGELEAERSLLAKVDLVLCVSQHLARQLRELGPSSAWPPIHVFPNYYNEHLFVSDRNWPEPEGLGGLPRPRILVAGHISDRIDWDGIREASLRRPRWTWIFKGSTDPGMPAKIDYILGPKGIYHPPTPLAEVPAWIAHCDAGAAPYRLSPFTLAGNPTKVIEYLGMGLPVLSTRTPSLERNGDAIEWVDEGNGQSYAQALDKIQEQLGDQRGRMLRRQAVAGDSLGNRVQQLREIVFSSTHEPPP